MRATRWIVALTAAVSLLLTTSDKARADGGITPGSLPEEDYAGQSPRFAELYGSGYCDLAGRTTLSAIVKDNETLAKTITIGNWGAFVTAAICFLHPVASVLCAEGFAVGASGLLLAAELRTGSEGDRLHDLSSYFDEDSTYRVYWCKTSKCDPSITTKHDPGCAGVEIVHPEKMILKKNEKPRITAVHFDKFDSDPQSVELSINATDIETSNDLDILCMAKSFPPTEISIATDGYALNNMDSLGFTTDTCGKTLKVPIYDESRPVIVVSAKDTGPVRITYFDGDTFYENGITDRVEKKSEFSQLISLFISKDAFGAAAAVCPDAKGLLSLAPPQWAMAAEATKSDGCAVAVSVHDRTMYPAAVIFQFGAGGSPKIIQNDGWLNAVAWCGNRLVAAGGRNDYDHPTTLIIDPSRGTVVVKTEPPFSSRNRPWSDFWDSIECMESSVRVHDKDYGATKTYSLK